MAVTHDGFTHEEVTVKAWIGDGCTGRLVGAQDAVVSIMDHGFTVGDGVFETLKVTPAGAFAMRRHLDRLVRSASATAAVLPDVDHVRDACERVIEANRAEIGELARLRITWTSGAAPLGSDRVDADPTLVIAMMAQQPWPATTSAISIPGVRNPQGLLAGVKTTSYGENVVALVRAHAAGASEAILGTTDGRLSEGTGSNVVIVRDGVAMTPTLASACLAGITRELALQWCDIVEVDVPFDDLAEADEVLILSSTRDIHPVTSLDGRSRSAGPVGAQLREEFASRASRDLDP